MKVKVFGIVWDTDGEDVDLPSEVTLEVSEDTDLENEIADILSDKYGWCVLSVDYSVE